MSSTVYIKNKNKAYAVEFAPHEHKMAVFNYHNHFSPEGKRNKTLDRHQIFLRASQIKILQKYILFAVIQ